jgi:hypothetical protein
VWLDIINDYINYKRFSPGNTISNTNKIDRQDNLNIIESDVKHHNHNPKLILKQIYYLSSTPRHEQGSNSQRQW